MKNNLKISVMLAAVLSVTACTDLVEKPYSEALQADFFTNAKSFEAALVPAYASLRGYIWNYWNISQHSSDETQVPTRGGDWGDGGQWVRINSQQFLPNEGLLDGLYGDLFTGVSRCNNAIETFKGAPDSVKEKAIFVAEARTLRAFYYYLLMDMFGNVPIVELALSDPANPPAQSTRAQVFAFCEKELKESIPGLLTDAPYARINKNVANAILAKLYLNAEVFTGTARFADCITACDAVINSGKYSLEANYFDNFKLANEGSKESIMVAGFTSTKDLGFPNQNFYMRTLHYNQVAANAWNGFCTVSEFYNTFDAADPRRQVMWVGQQFSDLTWPAQSRSGRPLSDRNGNPLAFTVESPITNASEVNGVRIPKYQPDLAAPGGQGENDFVILRLADIILSKAEALARSGNTAAALPLVNQVRARAFGNTSKNLTSITVPMILKERGNELFWEGFRRQDQIRFGTFWDAYTNKPSTIADRNKTNLYPIPTNALASNPKLKQNPGY